MMHAVMCESDQSLSAGALIITLTICDYSTCLLWAGCGCRLGHVLFFLLCSPLTFIQLPPFYLVKVLSKLFLLLFTITLPYYSICFHLDILSSQFVDLLTLWWCSFCAAQATIFHSYLLSSREIVNVMVRYLNEVRQYLINYYLSVQAKE